MDYVSRKYKANRTLDQDPISSAMLIAFRQAYYGQGDLVKLFAMTSDEIMHGVIDEEDYKIWKNKKAETLSPTSF